MNLTELQNRANILVEAVNEYESNLTGITVDENEILEQHIYLDTHSLCSIFNYIFGKNWSDKSTNNPESILTNDYPFFIGQFGYYTFNPMDFSNSANAVSYIANEHLSHHNVNIYSNVGIQSPYYSVRPYYQMYSNNLDNIVAFLNNTTFKCCLEMLPNYSMHPHDAQLIESEVTNLRRIDTEAITRDDSGFLLSSFTGVNMFTLPEQIVETGSMCRIMLTKPQHASSPFNLRDVLFGSRAKEACNPASGCGAINPDGTTGSLCIYNGRPKIDFDIGNFAMKVMLPPFTIPLDDIGMYTRGLGVVSNLFLPSNNPNFGTIDREVFNENNYGNGVHIWFEPVTKQRRAGCKAAGVDFLPGAGDTDDQGVALAVILAHCKPVLENFYFPDNLEKFYSEDGSKAAELADLFLTTCDIDSDVTDEAFFTTDNTTADTETGEQNTDRSCKNRFTYEMLANVYDLPL